MRNSWASCCPRVARRRDLSDCMRVRAMVSGWSAVEKEWGVLRWWSKSALAEVRGVVSGPSLMVSK